MNRHQASIPSRPRLLPCLALILAGSLLCGPAHAATYWYEDYLKAVRLIDKGQVNEARPFLEKAISKKPLSHHAQRIVGNDTHIAGLGLSEILDEISRANPAIAEDDDFKRLHAKAQ